MKKLILSILFLPILCLSHETEETKSIIKIQYGVAFNTEKTIDTRVKSLNIGYYTFLRRSVSLNINGGYLGDSREKLHAGYICGQFGTSLNPLDWIFVENYFGPCYFSATGSRLSGSLQFATNMGLGWRDPKTGSELGINWKHFSNAGISKPNIGRDLLMLSIAFGL